MNQDDKDQDEKKRETAAQEDGREESSGVDEFQDEHSDQCAATQNAAKQILNSVLDEKAEEREKIIENKEDTKN